MNHSNTGRFFSGKSSTEFFDNERQFIINSINSKSQNDLLSISIEKYSEYLYSFHYIDYPLLDTTNFTISSYEGDIPGSSFPNDFNLHDRNKLIKKDIIVFHVPYEGDISYLNYRPSTYLSSGIPAPVKRNNELLFNYINFYNDPERIRREFNNDLLSFKRSYIALKADIESYNNGLKDFIVREINNRRQELLEKNNFLSSFNVPLKSKFNTPKTFTIPSPKLREKITIKNPIASNSGFTPEPTLDYDNYVKILKIIDDVGRNFERLPSIYKSKKEEDLRDHILMVLDPNFEYGSATGETFNMKGKTDILLRHDSSVAFVAECKFWGGDKKFLKTIDQLLSYLTWRDSKTAVVIFVRTKEIIPILEKIKVVIPKHNCYITTKGQKSNNWSEHIFHLPADKNKEVVISILIFHLPEK
ncbi:hypothetical protein [Limnovirga soli]|uniref:Uncharacterized protein n=1 Tax=Limnovirga soli TaxID=2656915 RepID=A0A8J8FE45_9BACT|nr:hypothetical protein [Limnovirga soli]NNV55028.1 hypothetical protein [Limnovirga soli]